MLCSKLQILTCDMVLIAQVWYPGPDPENMRGKERKNKVWRWVWWREAEKKEVIVLLCFFFIISPGDKTHLIQICLESGRWREELSASVWSIAAGETMDWWLGHGFRYMQKRSGSELVSAMPFRSLVLRASAKVVVHDFKPSSKHL